MPKTGNAPHLIRIHPTPTELRRVVHEFGSDIGYVTALEDGVLYPIKQLGFHEDHLELVPFGELLGRIGMDADVPSRGLASRGQLLATVKLVCDDLSEDSIFQQVKSFPGFHDILLDVIRELRYAGLDSEKLLELIPNLTPELGEKLHELATIDRMVEKSLEAIGKIGAWRRVDQLLEADLTKDLHFRRLLVFVGKVYRPNVMRLLTKLANHGLEVKVVVEASPNAFEIESLITRAIEPRLIKSPQDPHWTQQLFGEGTAESGPETIIFSAADVLAECEWALRLCRDAKDRGVHDHRIAIVIPNTDVYAPLLRSVGDRFGIAVDVRLVVPLLTNGFASMMKKTLQALVSDDIRDILSLCHSSYFPTTFQQRKALKEYLDAAVLAETASWQTVWNYARDHEDELPWLAEMMQWRQWISDQPLTIAEWTQRFYELTIIDSIAASASDADGPKVAHDRRAQMALLRAIQEYAPSFDFRKAQPIQFKQFTEIAISLWERESTVLPSAGKGIRVVREPWEAADCDVMVALGILEGSMPRRRAEEPILSDADRTMINALLPHNASLVDSHFAAKAERDAFVRICGAPSQQLILSYPESGEDRDNVPASYLEEVRRTLGPEIVKDHVYKRKELFGQLASGYYLEADLDLMEAMEEKRVRTQTETLTLPDAQAIVRPNFEEGIKIRELLDGLMCPFQSAAFSRLSIRRNSMRFEQKIQELPKKAHLAKASTEEDATRSLKAELNSLLRTEAYQVDEWEIALAEATGNRMIEGWVESEFSSRKLWGIKNVRANVDLEDPIFRSTFNLAGQKVKFIGTVDALSEIGPYTAVRLYKTGTTIDFPSQEKDRRKWLEYMIYGCMLNKSFPAIEVDHGGTARVLHVLKRRDGDGLTGRGKFLKVDRRADEEWIPFLDKAKEEMVDAISHLASGAMEATPTEDACKNCQYGDLCRVSTELADVAAEILEVGVE